MAQGFGDNSWIGVGAESTFGTAVARSKFFEFLSESIKLDQGREARSSLRGRSKNRRGQKKKSVGGSFEMQMQVNGMETLLKHALGAVSTSGAGPYTHTFTLARSLPTGLSVEVNRDSSNIGSTSSFLYEGCQISKVTFKHEPGAFLHATFEIVGEGDASLVSVSTPTFATFVGWDWVNFSCAINGVATTIKSLDELILDNNLATDRYVLGSNKRRGFGPAGARSVTGKITLEFDSLTALNHFRNQNNYGIGFTWTDGGTSSIVITVTNAEFTEGDPTVADAGPIHIQLGFEGYLSSTEGDEFNIVLINDTAGPVA